MGMPQLVVTAVLLEGRSKSEVARDYGVSRRWVIELVQRYLAEGDAGLTPRSRRPRSSPGRTPSSVEEEIVELRKELDRDGHDAGAATIADHLHRRHGTSPAVSTIWRILTARGFITPQPHKRPKSSYVRFEAVQPNERWQVDITHWTLADGTDVEICNWLDDHSRFCLASTAAPVFTAPSVDQLFRDVTAEHGDPAGVLSDNGAVFTGRYRGGGRVALEVTLHARGVVCSHCRPYHPQTCGKVERFHQTLKNWLTRQPRATTLADLQAQLDAFRGYYNHRRPHRALTRRTPAEAYTARPKAAASGVPLIDGHFRVRHDTVDSNGKLTLRHNSRLHHIGIGRRHARTPVLLLVHDLHVRVLTTSGRLLTDLQLDPTRDYQRQAPT
ncbi:IS481 family transposase [Blastococcus sp. MG754426]|uniref:IS481 family transposase n=1 Tax=unclassified Blastococcus TaxID=2619396 RepID=UPI001EF0D8E5|nr:MULTISPECIES: IS481 family transposase [unclassified Blastococcus]MCF6509424.1 IS481 family transposase [Blastococcus sp. MG754426]MCF6513945.1 IS481 family transposase [Blastococcus sp. MG754427]MCF6737718.1 IS481 family transposase [Blastococcus sp. KM273129]